MRYAVRCSGVQANRLSLKSGKVTTLDLTSMEASFACAYCCTNLSGNDESSWPIFSESRSR